MTCRFTKTIQKYKLLISSIISFSVPLAVYLMTMEKKLVGGDTSWFAIQVPAMEVLAPTGYPAFSIFGKLFSVLPVRDIAFRLNLMSVFFGALTILFLFLAINRLVKNEIISLASSLTFAFLISFWSIANRFEMDTINSFFIALILFAAFLYKDKRSRKYLYFCFAALGLCLTDHPIALFVMPAFLLYVIIINPGIFKSAKAVLLSILFFILPLSFYAFIPIRSMQGYGPVNSLKDFIFYLTGRYTSGQVHGGSFFDKDLESILKVTGEFFRLVYINYGIILLVITAVELVYLFIKNYKFAICSLLVILLNLVIISMFINWAAQNHVIDTLIIISVYVAMGFLLIFDAVELLFRKIQKLQQDRQDAAGKDEPGSGLDTTGAKIIETGKTSRDKPRVVIIKNITIIILLLIFFSFPVLLAFLNYDRADSSEIEDIYIFWNRIFDTIEDGSSIYVASLSANIGKYIDIYEKPQKNINFVQNKEPEYSIENIKKDLIEGRDVYLVNIEDFLMPLLNIEVLFDYLWPRFEEGIILYRVSGEKLRPVIEYNIESDRVRFGDTFGVEYVVSNENDKKIIVNSLELELPDGLEFLDVSGSGDINDTPTLEQGKYLWVKDYSIYPGEKLNIIMDFRALKPGEPAIKFRITSQGTFFEAEEAVIKVLE